MSRIAAHGDISWSELQQVFSSHEIHCRMARAPQAVQYAETQLQKVHTDYKVRIWCTQVFAFCTWLHHDKKCHNVHLIDPYCAWVLTHVRAMRGGLTHALWIDVRCDQQKLYNYTLYIRIYIMLYMLEKSFVKGSLLLSHSFYVIVQLVERQFWIWPPSFFARSSVLSCSIMFYPWTSHAQACASILLHLLQLASASAALWSRSQWLLSLESFQQGLLVHYNYTESQVRLPRLRLWLRLCIVLVLRRHIDIVYI